MKEHLLPSQHIKSTAPLFTIDTIKFQGNLKIRLYHISQKLAFNHDCGFCKLDTVIRYMSWVV